MYKIIEEIHHKSMKTLDKNSVTEWKHSEICFTGIKTLRNIVKCYKLIW